MNILFLTHRLPYAPNRGDRIRSYHLLGEMSRFASVSVFSLVHDDDEASHAARMPFAARVATARVPRLRNLARAGWSLLSTRSLTHVLLDAPGVRDGLRQLIGEQRPDLVVAYCSGVARFALEPPLDAFPFVVDFVDVDSAKWAGLARDATQPRRWVYDREARTLATFERAATARAKAVLVVNAREREALLAVAPGRPVYVLENGIDVAAFANPGPPADQPVVIFCGVMNYEPNLEGVVWFIREVWPSVVAVRPDARFVIVGARPPRRLATLAARDPSIEITGSVEAVQPHLWHAAASVAPLRLARGLQNKVLEALAAGLPAVVTSSVASGLPRGVDRGCLVADEAPDFARAVVDVLGRSPEARRATAAAAGVDTLAWPVQFAPLQRLLEQAIVVPDAGTRPRNGWTAAGRERATGMGAS